MTRRVDQFSQHEALDRAYMAMTIVDYFLLEHPGCKANKAAYRHIKIAFDALFAAYQLYGRAHVTDSPKRKRTDS